MAELLAESARDVKDACRTLAAACAEVRSADGDTLVAAVTDL